MTEIIALEPQAAIIQVRGSAVMLDSEVAIRFGVETKHVNQAVDRNIAKFSAVHCFQLSDEEFVALRSQSVTSNAGRGGRRYAPRVFTIKGVARLATVLNSEAALQATDMIIDTFVEVQGQIMAGQNALTITQPSRLTGVDPLAAKIRAKLSQAVEALLDAIIDVKRGLSVRDTAQEMTSDALEHLRERLRTKGLENEKIASEVAIAMAEAERTYAEARKINAEAQTIETANIKQQMEIVRELRVLYQEAEPPAFITMISDLQPNGPRITRLSQETP
jgi:ORF6N domain